MTRKISKFGNSSCILFDTALMDLARLKVGDQVNVELHSGGTITLTPINPRLPDKVSRVIKTTKQARRGQKLA